MKDINWCFKQSKGIKIIEPNENLCEEYLKSSQESLRVLNSIKDTGSNIWLATTKYYTEYLAIYAILMKIGIKCEIHDCTIKLIKILEDENILKNNTHKKIEEDKRLRIDNQYYLKNIDVNINIKDITEFILEIKTTIDKIKDEDIKRIRSKFILL